MSRKTSQLSVDVRPGDLLFLGDGVVVELLDKSGKLARLRVTAPRDMKIQRTEGEMSRAMRDSIPSS